MDGLLGTKLLIESVVSPMPVVTCSYATVLTIRSKKKITAWRSWRKFKVNLRRREIEYFCQRRRLEQDSNI